MIGTSFIQSFKYQSTILTKIITNKQKQLDNIHEGKKCVLDITWHKRNKFQFGTDNYLFEYFGVINKCEGMDDYWNSLSFVFSCLNPVILEVVGCR